MEWKPIETAPKDGTRFLAYDSPSDDCDICMGIVTAFWWEGDEEYDGYFEVNTLGGDYLDLYRLTHWMPLPKPPVLV